jgi:hypothetical protein
MEVHAHTHTPRKKWTHYFWEFLMLFLAVFCGFLAEYQLEHKIEKDREKKYMHSLINDLHNDTALINFCIYQTGFIINGHDSLEYMLENFRNEPAFIKKLYVLNTAFTYIDHSVNWTQGTFEELKGSGHLRLINKQEVKKIMQQYETIKEGCRDQHQYAYNAINQTYEAGAEIFDVTYYKPLYEIVQRDLINNVPFLPYDSISQYINGRPVMLTTDAITLKKYLRLINNEKNQIILYLSYLKAAIEKAIALISSIKKNYHMK